MVLQSVADAKISARCLGRFDRFMHFGSARLLETSNHEKFILLSLILKLNTFNKAHEHFKHKSQQARRLLQQRKIRSHSRHRRVKLQRLSIKSPRFFELLPSMIENAKIRENIRVRRIEFDRFDVVPLGFLVTTRFAQCVRKSEQKIRQFLGFNACAQTSERLCT